MRRYLLVLLAVFLVVSTPAQLALADGMVLPQGLVPGYWVVREHHVTVTIEDQHAVTRVEQEFANPTDGEVTGRYLFPIPPGAAVTGFAVEINGEAQPVIHQDAATTNSALQAAITAQRDPSLLRYADWESLAFDLTLPARGTQRMVLRYEEILQAAGGMFHYRYTLSTERYSAAPLEAVSVKVTLAHQAGLASIYSPSHAINVTRSSATEAEVLWEAENVLPAEDFELAFAPAEGGFGGGFLTGERNGQGHFLFTFAPELRPAEKDVLPKDIIFVIDRSGSMSGEKIIQAQNALQFILGQLHENDRFAIVGFDDQLDLSADTLEPVNRESLARARRFVSGLDARGNTDIDLALRTGLDSLKRSETRPGAARLLVFLTDGLPTAGITDENEIINRASDANGAQEARFHVFGVGYDVNTHLLDALAAQNGGSVTYVQPGENLELVLSDFYRRIANPVLTGVTLSFEGMTVSDLSPKTLPDLFAGSSLLVLGRYQAQSDAITVRVSGLAGTEPREFTYRFNLVESGGSRDGGYDFVPRLWATRRVGELLDIVRVEGESAALVEQIRELGLAYGLVTPYTTFVIAGQTQGAASMENMLLYQDQGALNAASGQTTIRARVQNQAYQDAAQVNVAQGSNISNVQERSVAQVSNRQLDLSLLQGRKDLDAEEAITGAWIEANIQVDRSVTFGSEEYFALAADPEARTAMQAGTNVIFQHGDEVIAIEDPSAPAAETPTVPASDPPAERSGWFAQILNLLWSWLGGR